MGKPRNAHLLRTTQRPPQPLLGRCKTLLVALHEASAESVAFPSPPPPPANPELRVARTSLPGPAVPAPPSPHLPRTLSNPLGSRRLLRAETRAAAGAGAARLGAGRRRGAQYGEPSNEARAGAQRRRVLAEHGRGAAAVAAGAQGPLHHWQPWSPSIFLPRGRRLGSAHVPGEEGAGARASPEGGGTRAQRGGVRAALVLLLHSRLVFPGCSRGPDGRGPQAAAASFSAALVARRAGAATAADAVQRNERWGWSVSANGAGERVGDEGGRRAGRGLWWLLLVLFSDSPVSPSLSRHRERRDQRPSSGGGGGATAGERRRRRRRRWRLGGGDTPNSRREDGVCACAQAPQT